MSSRDRRAARTGSAGALRVALVAGVTLLGGGSLGCWEQVSPEWWPQMKRQLAVQAFEYNPYAPKPGDIICRGRGRDRDIADYLSLPDGAELHCDLVVANAGGKLESIGGNVRQSVSLSEREVDAAGRLGAPWFVVIENRYPDPPLPVASTASNVSAITAPYRLPD